MRVRPTPVEARPRAALIEAWRVSAECRRVLQHSVPAESFDDAASDFLPPFGGHLLEAFADSLAYIRGYRSVPTGGSAAVEARPRAALIEAWRVSAECRRVLQHSVLAESFDDSASDFLPPLGGHVLEAFADTLARIRGYRSVPSGGIAGTDAGSLAIVVPIIAAQVVAAELRVRWFLTAACLVAAIGLPGGSDFLHGRRIGLRQGGGQGDTDGQNGKHSLQGLHGRSLLCRVQPVAAGAERGRWWRIAGIL
jgi:hypothetical protein